MSKAEQENSEVKGLKDFDLTPSKLANERRSRRVNFLFRPTVHAAMEYQARCEGISCNALMEQCLVAMLRAQQKKQ